MSEAPGLDDWSTLGPLGRATLAFLRDTRWVSRRVETVRFLNATTLERRITLDLDRAALGTIASTAGLPPDADLCVPLAVLRKGLLLDLDLRTGDDRSAQIVTSDVDSRAAQAAAMAELEDAGVDITTLSKAIRRTIYDAARCTPTMHDVAVLTGAEADDLAVDSWALVGDLSSTEGDQDAWQDLLDSHDRFTELLTNFTLSFMLMTPLARNDLPGLLKFRYIETQEPSAMLLRERLGLGAFQTLVEAPSVGDAAREHLRIECPAGVAFQSAHLWSLDGSLQAGQHLQAGRSTLTYQKRVGHQRAAVYTSQLPRRGLYALALEMRANPSGFLRRSQYFVGVTAAMLAAGSVAEFCWKTLKSLSHAAEPTVALLLLVPTVLLAFVAREGDHQILGDLLRLPRLIIASIGFATLVSAASIVLELNDEALGWIWAASALWCVIVAVWLRIVVWLANRASHRVAETQGVTVEVPVVVFKV